MGFFDRVKCTVYYFSTQTSPERINCTKAQEKLRTYCPNIYNVLLRLRHQIYNSLIGRKFSGFLKVEEKIPFSATYIILDMSLWYASFTDSGNKINCLTFDVRLQSWNFSPFKKIQHKFFNRRWICIKRNDTWLASYGMQRFLNFSRSYFQRPFHDCFLHE